MEQITEGKLSVLPLDSNFALRARRQVFGEDAPHKPTLLKVTQGKPRAWTGARMAPLVAREVGFEASLRILKVLGIERSGGNIQDIEPRLLSRRGFVQIAGGVAASFGILAAGSFAGAVPVSAAKLTPNKAVSRSRLEGLIEAALDSRDFLNVVDPVTLQKMRVGSVFSRVDVSEPQYQITSATSKSQTYSANDLLVQASSRESVNGDEIETLAITLENAGVSYVVTFGDSRKDIRAERYAVNFSEESIEIVDASADGIRMEPIPEGITARSADPCGGCSGTLPLVLGPVCKSSNMLSCALASSSCIGCTYKCSSSVGTGKCVTCLLVYCGGALKQCCEKTEPGACFPCGGGKI